MIYAKKSPLASTTASRAPSETAAGHHDNVTVESRKNFVDPRNQLIVFVAGLTISGHFKSAGRILLDWVPI